MRGEFQNYNDADMIEAQFGNAALAQAPLLFTPVAEGSIGSIGGATGTTIGIASGGAVGFGVTASGVPGTLTLSITVTNATLARTALGIDQIATKKSNLTATIAPTVANDNTQGYAVGSFWMGTVLGAAYVCLDASTGAAVWSKITP